MKNLLSLMFLILCMELREKSVLCKAFSPKWLILFTAHQSAKVGVAR